MIDYIELRRALQEMQPRQKLYELVKVEMQRRGNWKKQPSGKPFEKGHDDRRHGLT